MALQLTENLKTGEGTANYWRIDFFTYDILTKRAKIVLGLYTDQAAADDDNTAAHWGETMIFPNIDKADLDANAIAGLYALAKVSKPKTIGTNTYEEELDEDGYQVEIMETVERNKFVDATDV